MHVAVRYSGREVVLRQSEGQLAIAELACSVAYCMIRTFTYIQFPRFATRTSPKQLFSNRSMSL